MAPVTLLTLVQQWGDPVVGGEELLPGVLVCAGSPHFSIVIKLLADQSLVGTAGVLEGKRKRAETFSAHASPSPGCSLACLSLPSASYACQGQRPWTKDWGGIPESSLAG